MRTAATGHHGSPLRLAFGLDGLAVPAFAAAVERSQDSRLRSRASRAQRQITAPTGALNGVGLRTPAVERDGRSHASREEAGAIAIACRDLLAGTSVTDDSGPPARSSPVTSSS